MITFFVPQKNHSWHVHSPHLFEGFLNCTIPNIATYSAVHGIPFFFKNDFLVDAVTKAVYWSKMGAVKHYLNFGYKWVIWTDVDVLFMRKDISLIDIWLSKARPHHHIALVGECDQFTLNLTHSGPVRR
jgi:hypothetical protein